VLYLLFIVYSINIIAGILFVFVLIKHDALNLAGGEINLNKN